MNGPYETRPGPTISCPSCESTSFYRYECFSGVDIINIYTGDNEHSLSREGNRYDAEWDGDWSCDNDHPVDDDTSEQLTATWENQ